MPGFIANGAEAYEKAIREEFELAKSRLEVRLKECGGPLERQTIENELRDLKKDFQDRLRQIQRSLFGTL
jgi:hypothetical protein